MVPIPRAVPFIVGCGRSGTTLLRAMLDSHPDLAIPQESYFLVPMIRHRRRYERGGGFDDEAFVTDLLRHRWFQRWDLPEAEARDAIREYRPSTISEACRVVYRAYANHHGKASWGDKTPSYALSVRTLAGAFPEAIFIHIIRDARDVALSFADVRFGPSTPVAAAVHWSRVVRRCHSAGMKLGHDRYMVVKYEDLLLDGRDILMAVCDRLSLAYSDAMLDYYRHSSKLVKTFERPTEHRSVQLPPTSGLRDWRRDMDSHDARMIEAIAGKTLGDFGYECPGALPTKTRIIAVTARTRLEGQFLGRRVRNRLLVER